MVDKLQSRAFLPSGAFPRYTGSEKTERVNCVRFCDKLLQLRREMGLSQEQLADRLGVSRQSVSKWEAGGTMPELEKIKAISDIFGVSVDYLVRDSLSEPERTKAAAAGDAAIMEQLGEMKQYMKESMGYEYKSRTMVFGLPLVHIRFSNDRSGRPAVAKGIVAIGNIAVGVISFGGISVGVLALGGISLGLLLALGGIGIGTLAFGGIGVGLYALGAIAVAAEFAAGAIAAGKVAIGSIARGEYALPVAGATGEQIKDFLLQHYPSMWDALVRLLSNMGQS